MKLRRLKKGDAPLMLEWMHDDAVVHYMKTNFKTKTMKDCIRFIDESKLDSYNLHLAIADDTDEYMGTVSLKHIEAGLAEFGIIIRSCAMGKGFSAEAMKEILKIGFDSFHLKEIFWCVDPMNTRAVRFYDKHSYKRCDKKVFAHGYSEEEIERYIWYHCISDKNLK